ncbi:hypothetical protein KBB68_01010 [Candidatus Babeliales bacterium]|nr:hypothetical protein [Candidatus Babeliales bacterium]
MLKKIRIISTNYLVNFLELQLIITLMSLPILIAWGLPISYMSPLSNLIFTPLLILFLWISCIFAIFALLGIPCTIFATALDKLTNIWMWLLSFSKPAWLLGFSTNTMWCSIIICACIIALYSYKKPATKNAVALLFGLCCLMMMVRLHSMKNLYQKIGDLPMIAIRLNHKNYLIDYGALCSKQNFYNNIDYTIIPQLIKCTGMTNIDTLVLCKPSKRLTKIALQFCTQMNVKKIIATTKCDCYKTLYIAYKNSDVQILPLIKKRKSS